MSKVSQFKKIVDQLPTINVHVSQVDIVLTCDTPDEARQLATYIKSQGTITHRLNERNVTVTLE